MLSPLDDFPIHQAALPVRLPTTSDRNFYDRYYFNCQPGNGDAFIVLGFGQYPNLGTTDAFVLVRTGDDHRVVRSTRLLGNDRMDTSVGPFSLEVVEGLQEIHFSCAPAATDTGADTTISFDLTFRGLNEAYLEPQHSDRDAVGRIYLDACRFAQNGTWEGWIQSGDVRFEVTPDTWIGNRDRSWGIRPSGDPEPPGAIAALPHPGFRWLYAPMIFEDHSIFFIANERADGSRIAEEAVRVYHRGDQRVHERLGRPEFELEWDDERRFVTGAQFTAGSLKIDVDLMIQTHLGVGTGYGFDPEWKHGAFRGEEVTQERQWDVTTEEARNLMWGIVESGSRFTTSDGQVGVGMFEYLWV